MPEASGPATAALPVPATDPADLLPALLAALHRDDRERVTLLRPVPGLDGCVRDFLVVADSGGTDGLAGTPSVGRTLRELFGEAVADRVVALNRKVLVTGRPQREDLLLALDADGTLRTPPRPAGPGGADLPGVPGSRPEVADPDPRGVPPALALGGRAVRHRVAEMSHLPVAGLVVVLWRDVTDERAADVMRRRREERHRLLLEHAADAIVVLTPEGTVDWSSAALAELLGGPGPAAGATFARVVLDDDRAVLEDLLVRAQVAPGDRVAAELRVVRTSGEVRWVQAVARDWGAEPAVGGVAVALRDVTAHRAATRRLEHLALEDALTGLPNRRWFTRTLREAVVRSTREGTAFAVVVLDVDDFKVVNDSLGHAAGDLLLVEMASRLVTALRPEHAGPRAAAGPGAAAADVAVARLGGDEFVVVAQGLDAAAEGAERALADRVAAAATGRYRIGPVASHVTVSLGVVTHRPADDAVPDAGADDDPALALDGPGGSRRAEELLAQADAALYEAKRLGRARSAPFTRELGTRVQYRLDLGSQLHHALEHGQLELAWQPIVRLRDRRVVAAEALLRWRHPLRGLVPAGEFLPLAGEVGLVPALSQWAVDAALAQAARWQADGTDLEVFINLAAVQLAVPELDRELAALAAWHGVDPHGIFFELSEEVLGTDVPGLGDRLRRKRERGFSIALDDFGAGNTALTWLRRMPVDVLKLDRSFASSVDEERTRVVVAAILRLARELGVRTIAEGVETDAQLAFFADAGCDDAQGYLLGRPGPVTALRAGATPR
ncbi:putative bifunctional diguanylate cyclase/phosphodiesterase [Cellulomonas endophytica]|uniref:putative bifunctional diguanylate cyclase/phosphodiesterase n=1 Tax=Cellulomonas endophytica TaxID=2494735 RepID=UPI00101318C2|nr:EAL domain-containing protein [Cellulomonas endophytica]